MRSRSILTLLAVLFLTFAAACGATARPTPTPPAASAPFPTTVTDFQGHAVTLSARPARLVSLGASSAALRFALGAGPRVVGLHGCGDGPADASKVDNVRGVEVNFEKIVSLRPDLVLTVKLSDGTIEKLESASLAVLVVDPQ